MKPYFFIGIELTRHCNLRCAHCFRADLDKFSEIPYEKVEKILLEAKAYNQPHISLTGGEASLHTRFADIIDLIVSHGYSFHFVTNGFKYKSLFEKLKKHIHNPLWNSVTVSLDGGTQETHDKIRGPKSFEGVMATIAMARTYGKEVVVQSVIHRGNRHELDELAILCAKMNVSSLQIAHMQPTPHSVEHGLLCSPQEFRHVESEVMNLQGRFKMPISMSAGFYDTSPIAHCRFLKHTGLNIDHLGRLTSCCQLSNFEGALNDVDIVADVEKEGLLQAHRKLLKVYGDVHDKRIEKKADGTFTDLDHFHCWSCMKHFKKADWMADFPENEWTQQDPYFQEPNKKLKMVNS